MQELNCFQKFRIFISLCVNCHLIERENIRYCSACDFIVILWCVFAQNLLNLFIDNVENLQEFCRVNHHILFKLRTVSRSLDEKRDIKNLLEQLNLPPSTKENGFDFKKELNKIGKSTIYHFCNKQVLSRAKYSQQRYSVRYQFFFVKTSGAKL